MPPEFGQKKKKKKWVYRRRYSSVVCFSTSQGKASFGFVVIVSVQMYRVPAHEKPRKGLGLVVKCLPDRLHAAKERCGKSSSIHDI